MKKLLATAFLGGALAAQAGEPGVWTFAIPGSADLAILSAADIDDDGVVKLDEVTTLNRNTFDFKSCNSTPEWTCAITLFSFVPATGVLNVDADAWVRMDPPSITLNLHDAVAREAVPVPEPGTWALMGAGLLALAGLGRRARQRRLPT
jgi:hypothetical protein